MKTIALEGLEVNELSPDLVILVDTDGDCEDDVITDTLGDSIPVKLILFDKNEDNVGERENPGDLDTLGDEVEEVVLDDDSDIIDDRVDEIETAGEIELINEREEETVTRAFEGVFNAVASDVTDETREDVDCSEELDVALGLLRLERDPAIANVREETLDIDGIGETESAVDAEFVIEEVTDAEGDFETLVDFDADGE